MSFQSEFNRIQDGIFEYPDIKLEKDSVKYRLAVCNWRILSIDSAIDDITKIMLKELSPIALTAAKILHYEDKCGHRYVGFLGKMLGHIVSNEKVGDNSEVICMIIGAITASKASWSDREAFEEVARLSKMAVLPSNIQYEIVRYAYVRREDAYWVKEFAESLATHSDESVRENIAIYEKVGSGQKFNWDAEIKKITIAPKSNADTFQQQFVETQEYITMLIANGPISDDDKKSDEYALVRYTREIERGNLAAKEVLGIMQKDMSSAALAAAEILSGQGLYASQRAAFLIKELDYVVLTHGIAENSEAISSIISHITHGGIDALIALDAIKQLSAMVNLPTNIRDAIVRYAFGWSYYSAEVYNFALSLKSHAETGFRKVAEDHLNRFAGVGKDWETEVKRELSYRGIEV